MNTSPRTSRFRQAVAAVGLTTAMAAGLLALPLAGTATAQESDGSSVESSSTSSAASATTMSFRGRGWGHGRGLSQWGAQGYATQYGWNWQQILDHYYGGTSAKAIGSVSNRTVDPNAVRIRLMAQDAHWTVISIDQGALSFDAAAGTNVPNPSDVKAVRLSKTDGGTLKMERAESCAGPWSAVGSGDGVTQAKTITVGKGAGAGDAQLRLCRDDGVSVWYPGLLRATVVDGTQHTVNVTSIEQQLRSVVPRESPASWDADALKAQSVAARSYALAGDTRHQPYADTCDTTLCQVYKGHAEKQPGGSKTATTDPRTDAAIAATAGVVRVMNGTGAVARTEFSSTSGGWTAGGTFPAVEDKGDAISPLHTWTRTVTVTGLEDAYGKGGTLVDIEVVERNGLGADGGRVEQAKLFFSNGVTAVVDGNLVRSRAGMLSDWFTPLCSTTSRYIHAVYELFVNRPASGDEVEAWCGRVRRGERQPLTDQLSVSDEWAGVQIAALYEDILRRPAEDGGRKFWLSQVENGMRIEEIAAEFYGSDEYFRKAGSTHGGYVDKLYVDLLGREADSDGRAFWVKILDRGQRTRTGVADEFYASIESRSDRVRTLYQQVLDRNPDRAGWDYWAGQLTTLGDVKLAAYLAASQEYYENSLIVDGS